MFAGFYNYAHHLQAGVGPDRQRMGRVLPVLPHRAGGGSAFQSLRRRLDPVAWGLIGLCAALMVYAQLGFPQWLADLMLWSRFPAFRAQLVIGLGSIVLSLYLLRQPSAEPLARPGSRRLLESAAIVVASGAFYLWTANQLAKQTGVFPRGWNRRCCW